jgi:hypothetical protein
VSEDEQREIDGPNPDERADAGEEIDIEQAAARIAERGREALVLRLRPAFHEAAAAHADLLDLNDEQIEEMVQRAADEADGLQWRRALASVATEELQLSLGEALGHPAVARAQELLGAPSYEQSLAALTARVEAAQQQAREGTAGSGDGDLGETEAVKPNASAADSEVAEASSDEPGAAASEPQQEVIEPWEREAAGWQLHAEAAPEDEVELQDELEPEDEVEPEDESAPLDGADHEIVQDGGFHEDADALEEEIDELRIAAIHLGGIANLSAAEPEVELRLAEPGLDIIRASGEVLGRLEWEQIEVLEVPTPRRRLRRAAPTHLVIRTARGDASFEVPGVEVEELREHLAPIIALYLPPTPE